MKSLSSLETPLIILWSVNVKIDSLIGFAVCGDSSKRPV